MQINVAYKNKKPVCQNTVFKETFWDIIRKTCAENLYLFEHKHVVLGLVFLKRASDAFMTNQKTIKEFSEKPQSCENRTIDLLLVPNGSPWLNIARQVHQSNVGQIMDYAVPFCSTPIPPRIGILSKKRNMGDVLFIDTRMMGHMEDGTCRILNYMLHMIATYYVRRNHHYKDVSGFCKNVSMVEASLQYYMLESWRCVWEISPGDVSSVWRRDDLPVKYDKPRDMAESSGVIRE